MLLRNYNNYHEIISVDCNNKIFLNNNGSGIPTSGFFIKSEGNILGIYVFDNKIVIRVDNKDIFFENIISIDYESNEMVIKEKGNSHIISYKNINLQKYSNLFFFEEEEDYDLCALIVNIFRNKNRQSIFISNNSS